MVRDGRRVVPTVRGERLADILPRALEQRAHALAEPEPFGPTAVRDRAEGRYDGLIAPAALHNEAVRGVPIGSWLWAVYRPAGHPAFERGSLKTWSSASRQLA